MSPFNNGKSINKHTNLKTYKLKNLQTVDHELIRIFATHNQPQKDKK